MTTRRSAKNALSTTALSGISDHSVISRIAGWVSSNENINRAGKQLSKRKKRKKNDANILTSETEHSTEENFEKSNEGEIVAGSVDVQNESIAHDAASSLPQQAVEDIAIHTESLSTNIVNCGNSLAEEKVVEYEQSEIVVASVLTADVENSGTEERSALVKDEGKSDAVLIQTNVANALKLKKNQVEISSVEDNAAEGTVTYLVKVKRPIKDESTHQYSCNRVGHHSNLHDKCECTNENGEIHNKSIGVARADGSHILGGIGCLDTSKLKWPFNQRQGVCKMKQVKDTKKTQGDKKYCKNKATGYLCFTCSTESTPFWICPTEPKSEDKRGGLAFGSCFFMHTARAFEYA